MKTSHAPVIVLDDEVVVGQLIAAVLKTRGYPTLVADRCADAERLLRDHAGDAALLITDIVMPDMNGPEFVQRLRDQGMQVPVLYISGYAETDPEKIHGLCERRYFLMKPFSAEELLAAVEKALAENRPA